MLTESAQRAGRPFWMTDDRGIMGEALPEPDEKLVSRAGQASAGAFEG